MGDRRWKKRGRGSQRRDAGFGAMARTLDRQSLNPGHSFESVPDWEKRFCSQMKWRDFCDKKRVVNIFPKILEWDDLDGREAFDFAKTRFWAKINNIPCYIPSPNSYMYTQQVDYDAYIDPSLIEDLYVSPPSPPSPTIPDLSSFEIVPTGWDVVDPSPTDNIPKFICIEPSTTDEMVDCSAHDEYVEGEVEIVPFI